ncbi:Hypothetical_protein [Hexamita inflata]|uniref:Hypothetical_protein n=1 Tax=Hexamita inflata TaxID=28002 RepID=A0ABP1GWY7_9EUKA
MKYCITQVITRQSKQFIRTGRSFWIIFNFAISCDKLFGFLGTKLFKIINGDFDEEFILDVIPTNITVYQKILFKNNGILILSCIDQFTDKIIVYVISLLEENAHELKDGEQFEVVLGKRGAEVKFNSWQLNLIQKRALEYIDQYESQQLERQFSSMIFNSKLELLLVGRIRSLNNQIEENRRQFEIVQNKINNRIAKTNEQQNLMVAKLMEYTAIQEQQ